MIICKKCGTQNTGGDQFCGNCGAFLEWEGEVIAPDGATDIRRIKSSTASRDPNAFELATMLGFSRCGEGRRAAKILEKQGVSQLLDKCDKLLRPGVGGANEVRKHIDEWPLCAQCRNHRTIKDGTGIHLCQMCSGLPGPKMSLEELIGQIRTAEGPMTFAPIVGADATQLHDGMALRFSPLERGGGRVGFAYVVDTA